MPFVSLTRLRLRSVRFLPMFAVYALRTNAQVRNSLGFQRGALLNDLNWTFWTLTAWDSQEAMRTYILSGAHRQVMPRLMNWCDEASVAHWQQDATELPPWTEADRRMRSEGRISKVLHPSPGHAGMNYDPPRMTRGGPITRAS